MWSWRGRGTSWSIVPERRRRSCLECSPSWAASSRPPRPAPRQPRAGAAGSFAARPSSPPNLHGIIRYSSNVEHDLTRSLAPAGGGDGSVAGGGHQPVAAVPGALPPPQGGAGAGVAGGSLSALPLLLGGSRWRPIVWGCPLLAWLAAGPRCRRAPPLPGRGWAPEGCVNRASWRSSTHASL